MAGISAKFEADFSQFVSAAATANGSLRQIESSSKDVVSAISEIAGAFGVAFSVDALVSFGKDVLTSTAALNELAASTGISTDALQKLAYVGQEFGVDLPTISKGVENFSAQLAG